jgi:branched-subunit amino acid transport protein
MSNISEDYPKARQFTAIYYVVLSIFVTLVFQSVFYALGARELLPFLKHLLLSIVIAAIFAALFAKTILKCEKNQKVKIYILGFLLVLCAMPFYNLGLLYIFSSQHPSLFQAGRDLKQYGIVYGFITIYNFLLAGLWLAILSGFAALHLRLKLYPDYVRFVKEQSDPSIHQSVDD